MTQNPQLHALWAGDLLSQFNRIKQKPRGCPEQEQIQQTRYSSPWYRRNIPNLKTQIPKVSKIWNFLSSSMIPQSKIPNKQNCICFWVQEGHDPLHAGRVLGNSENSQLSLYHYALVLEASYLSWRLIQIIHMQWFKARFPKGALSSFLNQTRL